MKALFIALVVLGFVVIIFAEKTNTAQRDTCAEKGGVTVKAPQGFLCIQKEVVIE